MTFPFLVIRAYLPSRTVVLAIVLLFRPPKNVYDDDDDDDALFTGQHRRR